MNDYATTWAADEARRRAEFVAGGAAHLDTLADRYVTAQGHVAAGGRRDGGPGGGGRRGPTLPVRVDVLDAVLAVNTMAARTAGDVRAALGVRARPRVVATAEVVRELGYWSTNLGGVADVDHGLAERVVGFASRTAYRLGVLLGVQSAAFPIAEECGACGTPALWVDPGRAIVRCGACGVDRAVDVDLIVYASATSGTSSEHGLSSIERGQSRTQRSEQ